MAFASVLGHERLKEVLAGAVARGRLPPALLFSGPDGVGKKTLALELARRLLCERPTEGEACGVCRHCGRILGALRRLPGERSAALERSDDPGGLNHRLHPDLLLVEAWRTGIKTEQVRDAARELAGLPFEAPRRVVIFDDAHAMTEPAANSLLKGLEEPPASSHVVLVSSAPQNLLPTVRSRCQRLRFGRLPAGLLAQHLESACGLPAAEARLRAGLAAGSLAAALAFESDDYRARRQAWLELLERLASSDPWERLAASDALAELDDPLPALDLLRGLLRDLAVLHLGAASAVLNTDVAEPLTRLARGPLGPRAARMAEEVAETRRALRGNAYKPLALDNLLERLAAA